MNLIDPEIAWGYPEIRNLFTLGSNKHKFKLKFDDLNDNEIDEFIDFINNLQVLFLNIEYDKGKKIIEVTGTIIENRRTALKIFNFLKDFAENYSETLKNNINNLTVNDLYNN